MAWWYRKYAQEQAAEGQRMYAEAEEQASPRLARIFHQATPELLADASCLAKTQPL